MKIRAIVISLLSLSIIGASTSSGLTESKSPLVADSHIVHLPIVTKSISEFAALMALYNSTNGPSWNNNTGWGVGDPCDMAWYGVECDSGHVQRLSLYGNHLSGSIPPKLGNLSSLEMLFLSGNQLSGPIPAELGNLRSLERLILDNNQLSGAIPVELGNLSSLQGLWLHYNQLSGAIPVEVGNLSGLTTLDLRHNQLSGTIPAELGNLSGLTGLSLSDNPSLSCWETEEALIWARGLNWYVGPDAVCP